MKDHQSLKQFEATLFSAPSRKILPARQSIFIRHSLLRQLSYSAALFLIVMSWTTNRAVAQDGSPVPQFSESSILQFPDTKGVLHVLAVAADGTTWHFEEGRKWRAENLGGNAIGKPSVIFKRNGLMQVWAVGRDHAIYSNLQKGGTGWSGWLGHVSPPAAQLSVMIVPNNSVLASIVDTGGRLQVASSESNSDKLGQWKAVAPDVQVSPVMFPTARDAHVVFLTRRGQLEDLTYAGNRLGAARPFGVERASGDLTASALLNGSIIVTKADADGVYSSYAYTSSGWSRVALGGATGDKVFRTSAIFSPDGTSLYALARTNDNHVWFREFKEREWAAWVDTELVTENDAIGALMLNQHIVHAGAHFLSNIAAAATLVQPAFGISISQVQPTTIVEGDQISVRYLLENGTQGPGTGAVTATWDSIKLQEQAPAFTPPLGSFQVFNGTFDMVSSVHATGGLHSIHVLYKASNGVHQIYTGTGWVQFEEVTQLAQDQTTVQVRAFADRWPTDAPAVTAGPYSCLVTTSDQQHACGDGSGTCAAGNTPQTCPQDCPVPVPDFRSYNSQDTCRNITGVAYPESIAAVQFFVKIARQNNQRLRVAGKSHTSNSQICTDGMELSMADMQGSVPLVNPRSILVGSHPSGCSAFDCTASIKGGGPVIETFEGVQTVRVGPGENLFDLEDFLDKQGLSLGFAVPGFREPTVGGAIATGTHGSSTTHPVVLSNRVRWLMMVMPDGTVREFSDQLSLDAVWKAVRANVGFLGVVVQLRLQVEPAFQLRATTAWAKASDLVSASGPQSLVSGCDFGEMVWFPDQGADGASVMVICGKATTDSGSEENTLIDPANSDDHDKAFSAVGLMQNDACNGQSGCEMERTRMEVLRYYEPPFTSSECSFGQYKVGLDSPPELVGWGIKGESGLALLSVISGGLFDYISEQASDCNANVVGKGYRMMSSKLTGPQTRPFERDWEIFIPGQNAKAALEIAKQYFKTNKICLPLIGVFLRFATPEDGTLIAHTVSEGPFASKAPGMFFEMPVFLPKGMKCDDQQRYEKVYADLAEILISAPINGRAHWGKNRSSLFQLQRRLGTYGVNLNTFRDVVAQTDPTGVFANQFGVDMGLRWPQMQQPSLPSSDTAGCTP